MPWSTAVTNRQQHGCMTVSNLHSWVHGSVKPSLMGAWQCQIKYISYKAISYPYTRNSSVGYSKPRKASPCGNLLRVTFSSIASKEQCTTKCSFRSLSGSGAWEGEKLWKKRGLFWGPTIAKQTIGMGLNEIREQLMGQKERRSTALTRIILFSLHVHTFSHIYGDGRAFGFDIFFPHKKTSKHTDMFPFFMIPQCSWSMDCLYQQGPRGIDYSGDHTKIAPHDWQVTMPAELTGG